MTERAVLAAEAAAPLGTAATARPAGTVVMVGTVEPAGTDAEGIGPLRLDYAAPITLEPLLRTIAAHAVPGVETCDVASRRHTRALPGGETTVTVEWDHVERDQPGVVSVSAYSRAGAVPVPDAVAAAVRGWLDLDADPQAIDAALGGSELLSPLVRARPGLRVLGSLDRFETAVMAILGQQVSLAAARVFGGRVAAAYGSDAPAGAHGLPAANDRAPAGAHGLPEANDRAPAGMRAFPTASDLAVLPTEELRSAVGLTRARAATVSLLANAVADGSVDLGAADPDDARSRLLGIAGIGPWTADYIALRSFGDRNACPANDLVLKRALGVTSARAVTQLCEQWAPLRAYAVTHLWMQEVYG